MATVGKVDGTDVLLYIDSVAVAHSTSCTVSLDIDMIDATTKDSAGWKENLEGNKGWTMEKIEVETRQEKKDKHKGKLIVFCSVKVFMWRLLE